jgi:hypothetical protein
MTSLRVFVDLTVQILNPSVGFPQLSIGLMLKFQYKQMIIDEVLIQLVYPMNHLIHSIK